MNRYIMKILFILIIIPSLFIIKCDGKNTLLKGNNKKDKGDENDKAKKYDVPEQTKTSTSDDGLILRPRLQCQELCRIECLYVCMYIFLPLQDLYLYRFPTPSLSLSLSLYCFKLIYIVL